ncbi:MAG: HD domain-containing protein [Spirochaetales bacterium]|nr:HD domain-containing protein [Spirochaetales bacterium]
MSKKHENLWKELGRPIYVGDRLQANLTGITAVSILSMMLGIVMLAINISQHRSPLIIASSTLFIVAGTTSAIASFFYRARRVSEFCAIFTCIVTFTFYAVSGSMNGFSVVWALVMPIGVSYFLSVRAGIFTSLYYEILCIVLFYTPIRDKMSAYYSDIVMTRYPIVFLTVASVTIVAMINYHRMALREIELTDHLNAEVQRQAAIAIERADKLELMNEEVVNMLAMAIDAKDRYTNGHSIRVATYSEALARQIGMPEDEIKILRREAMLHDIGKIGIPDAVLNNPNDLSEEEFKILESHTTIGARILEKASGMEGARDVAEFHHERYDGKGYPKGLKGNEIPFHARIVSIADAYDAMNSDRIYRKSLKPEAIRSELAKGRGTQFDPELLNAFLKLFNRGILDDMQTIGYHMLFNQE